MKQSHVKTPCRRVGLRRIPSASKSDPSSTSVNVPMVHGNHETPKSRTGQSKMLCVEKTAPPQRRLSDSTVTSADTDASPLSSDPKSSDQLSSSSSKPFLKRPLDLTDPLTENSSCQDKSKKQRVDSSPTVEDLHALRRRVAQKERQLKELNQAQIICNKHNPEKLESDIQHWLQACQEALHELLSAVTSRGGTMNMEKLLEQLGIPSSLVNFNKDSDDFD